MSASACKFPALALALLAATACDVPAAQWRFGENVTGLVLTPFSATVGIHPSTDVIADPQNPFRMSPVGAATKWQLFADGGPVAGFYAFATLLVYEPTGEHQYYSALGLQQAYETGAVAEGRGEEVRALAIAGFQSVLDHFPESLGYDATGTTSFRLATPAYRAIVALGGTVTGDWTLVATPAGGVEAVRASELP